LAVDANGWHQLSDQLSRISALGNDRFLELIELGPDLDAGGSGVYLAMEAPLGGSLNQRSYGLSEAQILGGMARIADAAHAMHEAGMTHGCIDGRSVLFTERGAVLGPPPLDMPAGMITRFTDWRAMAAVDPDLLCGESASRSSDIWSLGATLHGALSRTPLYRGMENDEPVTAVQRLLFSPPTIDGEIRPVVADIILSCLQPNPANRPATADEVAERLRSAGAQA
jgi:serine/threonine protein kinase